MAKNTTEAEVTVTLNGDAARNELKRLQDELKKYNDAAEDAYKHGNKALGDEMTKNAERLGKEFRVSKKELKDFSDFMKSLNSKSLSGLKSAATQLKSQIKGLSPDTQQFIDKTKQLQQVNSRIKQLESSFKGLVAEEKQAAFSIKGLADGFNKYFGIATAAVGAITGVSMAFRKCAEDAAMLDDVYSDVMKTTGLTHDEVQALDEELMKLDTRTSREQLLNLARDAGKLGIQGSNDVLAFVRAADQIQVALGEDLGDGAIKNLGKISDVFGYTKKMGIESSMLSIGSAINAVGQSSTASEAYLVDFTQRLAGVGAQTGISAANIIGFASGLDQSAMKVEMAATAFQTFLTKLYEDPAKFAQYAGMQVKEFTDLLNNDANTAVITILQNLKDQDGFAALVPIFKDMGVDGARATSVLAAMASNLTAITDAQSLANVEFEKATSLADEFATKNNNMQASLDKARKEFKNASIALGQSLNPILLKSTNATTYLIKALANYGKEIKTVLIVIAALTAALKLKVIWQKVVATWNATLRAGSLALAAAQALLTGNVTRAAAAWKMMSVAMKTTVFGLAVAAISALVIWIQRLNKETKELSEYEKFEAELRKDLAQVTSDEAAKVKALKSVLDDSNQSYENRKAALDELKKIVPDYHADLTKEGELINNNVDALNNYIAARMKAAREAALDEKLKENAAKQLEQEQYLLEHAAGFKDPGTGDWRYSYTSYNEEMGGYITHMISADCEAAIAKLNEFKKEEQLILETINEVDVSVSDGSSQKKSVSSSSVESTQKVVDKQIQNLKDLKKSIRDQIQEQMDIAEADRDKRDFSNYRKSDIVDPKANEEFWKEIYAKRDSIVAACEDESLSKEYEIEMMWLDKLHQKKLLSEEIYQKAVLKTKLSYAQKAAQQVSEISDAASSFVSSLQNAELAHAEANYQAQLTAAGNNAEKREALEAQYEKRKLDIQKKYADANMVIDIAKTTAAGAVAAIRAYAEGGPYAGPILAAIIAATTAAEVATIIAQRNAIKSQTVSMPTSSASAAGDFSTETSGGNIGSRVVTGYAKGGFTENHTTLTTVGERGTEWIAPHWMVKQNPITFANLESYRRAGSHGRSGSVARGFADGGYTPGAEGGENGFSAQLAATLSANTDASNRLASLIEKGLHAYVVLSELNQAQDKQNRFNEKTSR